MGGQDVLAICARNGDNALAFVCGGVCDNGGREAKNGSHVSAILGGRLEKGSPKSKMSSRRGVANRESSGSSAPIAHNGSSSMTTFSLFVFVCSPFSWFCFSSPCSGWGVVHRVGFSQREEGQGGGGKWMTGPERGAHPLVGKRAGQGSLGQGQGQVRPPGEREGRQEGGVVSLPFPCPTLPIPHPQPHPNAPRVHASKRPMPEFFLAFRLHGRKRWMGLGAAVSLLRQRKVWQSGSGRLVGKVWKDVDMSRSTSK